MSRDAGDELQVALCMAIPQVGLTVTVPTMASLTWQSATFDGHLHRLTLLLEGPSAARIAEAFIASLPDREFPMRGHALVDIEVTGQAGGCGREEISLTAKTVKTA